MIGENINPRRKCVKVAFTSCLRINAFLAEGVKMCDCHTDIGRENPGHGVTKEEDSEKCEEAETAEIGNPDCVRVHGKTPAKGQVSYLPECLAASGGGAGEGTGGSMIPRLASRVATSEDRLFKTWGSS